MGDNSRAGRLSAENATAALDLFEETVTESFILLLPDRDDYERARHMLREYETGLRSGDALHLAIAANHDTDTLMTFDRRMISAAESLGVSVGSL
jgi:predicted nucleic acid-binding protein